MSNEEMPARTPGEAAYLAYCKAASGSEDSVFSFAEKSQFVRDGWEAAAAAKFSIPDDGTVVVMAFHGLSQEAFDGFMKELRRIVHEIPGDDDFTATIATPSRGIATNSEEIRNA